MCNFGWRLSLTMQKNLDLYVQLPNELSSYEIVARQMLSERFLVVK